MLSNTEAICVRVTWQATVAVIVLKVWLEMDPVIVNEYLSLGQQIGQLVALDVNWWASRARDDGARGLLDAGSDGG
eukprot:CAMPEP_0119485938 /NCGR_PEP_ID=MMETSP1344-20130328/12490_1 /TAXON_ID=236787 /ORGANISM="Florenciella parvula, Strain CCMP2471" /LENGTH=75 /DNA_ID=CAMNT_0007520647 /DNA_START=105 /DNA_END=331 /DNA_ORIENTATION=+